MSFFLSPIGNEQQFNANGEPLNAGRILTYLAGSTTPTATYTDNTGATQQANPIILNSLGLPASPIWLNGGITYKFVIQDANLVTLRTVDNISGINDTTATQTEWVSSGFVPTFISATSFSIPGDQTGTLIINRRLRTQNTAGLIYSTISNSVFAATITTVTVVNDSGVLDSGLSSVAYGLLAPTNLSVPTTIARSGANSDITSVTALASINSGQIGGRRNHVINGGMTVANGQAATLSATAQYGPVDMMLLAVANATGISGSLTQDVNNNWDSGFAARITAASWTTGQAQIFHRMESKNTQDFAGRTITVSCKVIQDTGGSRTFAFALRKANAADDFSAVTAISTSFGGGAATSTIITQLSGTITLSATDPLNGLELVVFDTAANTVVNKNYYFGDLQVELGSVATKFERRDIGEEELACMRYYQPRFTGVGKYTSTTTAQLCGAHAVPMRTTPTATFISGSVGEIGVANRVASAAVIITANRFNAIIQYTTAVATSGNAACAANDLLTGISARL